MVEEAKRALRENRLSDALGLAQQVLQKSPITEKMFLWFAMGRTFAYRGYPLWVDAMEMWRPVIPSSLHQEIRDLTFAIGFADNECIDASFPANNPISGAPAIVANNPMSPLYKDSFW